MNSSDKVTRDLLQVLSKEQIIEHFLKLQDLYFDARNFLERMKDKLDAIDKKYPHDKEGGLKVEHDVTLK